MLGYLADPVFVGGNVTGLIGVKEPGVEDILCDVGHIGTVAALLGVDGDGDLGVVSRSLADERAVVGLAGIVLSGTGFAADHDLVTQITEGFVSRTVFLVGYHEHTV